MKTGAPAAPAQGAALCLAAPLDDWVLPKNHVPLITHNPKGELRTVTPLLSQHLASYIPKLHSHKGFTIFT